MPAIRRIAKRHRDELTPVQRSQLLTGWTVSGVCGAQSRFKTLEDFRAAWNEHRDELLPDYIERHPGHRPLAWWIVDRGVERPLNDAGREREAAIGRERMRYGDRYREFFGFLHSDEWQVNQTDFLRECGLLADGEERAIAQERASE